MHPSASGHDHSHGFPSKGGRGVDELPSPQTGRQMDYIRTLQQKNRIKQAMSAKSEEELQQERRERGFDNHINGANERRPRLQSDGSCTSSSSGHGRRSRAGSRSSGSGTSSRSASHRSLQDGWEDGGLVVCSKGVGRGGVGEGGREEGGEGGMRRRKSWSTDQPLQYIAGEDGKLVPVRRHTTPKGTHGGVDMSGGGAHGLLAPRVVAPHAGFEDGGPGSYEDDFEDVEEEQQQGKASPHNGPNGPRGRADSVDYEDVYEDEDEDEDEESWHVDEARLHDAFRMQARQAAPGRGVSGGGDRGEWMRGGGQRLAALSVSPEGVGSRSPVAGPLTAPSLMAALAASSEDLDTPKTRPAHQQGRSGRSGRRAVQGSEGEGSEVEDEVGSGPLQASYEDMEFEEDEDDEGAGWGSGVHAEGSIYSDHPHTPQSREGSEGSADEDVPETEEGEEEAALRGHEDGEEERGWGGLGKRGTGRRPTRTTTPLGLKGVSSLCLSKTGPCSGVGSTHRGPAAGGTEEDVRRVAAAIEKENSATPRVPRPAVVGSCSSPVSSVPVAFATLRPLSRTALKDSDLFGKLAPNTPPQLAPRPPHRYTDHTKDTHDQAKKGASEAREDEGMGKQASRSAPAKHSQDEAHAVAAASGPCKPADGSPAAVVEVAGSVCVEHILSALDRMSDDEKRRVLLKLKPEASQRTGEGDRGPEERAQEGKGLGGGRSLELGGEAGGRQGDGHRKLRGSGEGDVEVVLRLHNTWGGTRAIGIEQLCVEDANGRVLPLTRDDVYCRTGLVKKTVAATDKMVQDLGKLLDGVVGSGSDTHMWLARLGDSPLDVCLRLRGEWLRATPPPPAPPTEGEGAVQWPLCLRVWNYCKGPHLSGVGAKDVDVLLDNRCVWSGVIEEGVADRQGGTVTSIPLPLPAAPPSRTTAVPPSPSPAQTGGLVPTRAARVGKGEEKGEWRGEKGDAAGTGSRAREKGHSTPTAPTPPTQATAQPPLPARAHDADAMPLWLGGKKEAGKATPAVHRGEEDREGAQEEGGGGGRSKGSEERGHRAEAKGGQGRERELEEGKAGTPSNASGRRRLSKTRLGQTGEGTRRDTGALERRREEEGEGTKVDGSTGEGRKDEGSGGRRRTSEPKPSPPKEATADACASPAPPPADGPRVVSSEASLPSRPRVSMLEEDDSLAQALHSTHRQPPHDTTTRSQERDLGAAAVKATMSEVPPPDRATVLSKPSSLDHGYARPDVPLNFGPVSKPYASSAKQTDPGSSAPMAPDAELLDLYRDVLDEDSAQASPPLASAYVDIPELPRGRVLELVVLSNWGDPNLVGLAGLDLFRDTGAPLLIDDPTAQVSLMGVSGVHVACEAASTVGRLCDGVGFTHDDLHVWTAPFKRGDVYRIRVCLCGEGEAVGLCMVRLWNFNRSRTQASRGVRHVQLVLDGTVVFEGEVRRAPGDLIDPTQCCEVVLFTLDDSILSTVEAADREAGPFRALWGPTDGATDDHQQHHHAMGHSGGAAPPWPNPRPLSSQLPCIREERMVHCPVASPVPPSGLFPCRTLALRLGGGTWGDRDFVGLGALRLLVGPQAEVLPLEGVGVDCAPARDLRSLGYCDDPRVLDNLLLPPDRQPSVDGGEGGVLMGWMLPLAVAPAPCITLQLPTTQALCGVVVWNYSRAGDEEATLRGAKQVTVTLDGRTVATYPLRKAAGGGGLDLGQVLLFGSPPVASGVGGRGGYVTYVSPAVRQDYETLLHPTGLLLKIVLHCSWGDAYYVGLDGLQVLGEQGQEVHIRPEQVCAWPSSLLALGQAQDCRIPANLVDGEVGAADGTHAWLAPLAASLPLHATWREERERHGYASAPPENVVCVHFDTPVTLCALRLWNYSKTPKRGVRELSVYLDGRLLYKGGLRRAGEGSCPQALLFTVDPAVVRREKENLAYCGTEEQDVLCIDERQVRVRSRFVSEEPDPCAEGVTIDLAKRPSTAVLSPTVMGNKPLRPPLASTTNQPSVERTTRF